MSTTISRLYNWVTDKANSVKITASRQDAELDQLIVAANRKALCASSAPSSPIAGQSWVDTSITPPLLKTYNGTTWDVVGHATGANIASASSVTFGVDGDSCTITGTTTITAFASMPAGTIRVVTFSGILTLTYNGTSLILPSGTSNITTAAGDVGVFLSLGSGNWKCLVFQPKAGNVYTPSATNALSGSVIQTVTTLTGAVATGTTAIPYDDTIPQITEGTEFMTRAITPNNSSNILLIEVTFFGTTSDTNQLAVALFQDATAGALAAVAQRCASGDGGTIKLVYVMAAGTTSSTTFRVRAGTSGGGTITINGTGGGRLYGGVAASSIVIKEIKA